VAAVVRVEDDPAVACGPAVPVVDEAQAGEEFLCARVPNTPEVLCFGWVTRMRPRSPRSLHPGGEKRHVIEGVPEVEPPDGGLLRRVLRARPSCQEAHKDPGGQCGTHGPKEKWATSSVDLKLPPMSTSRSGGSRMFHACQGKEVSQNRNPDHEKGQDGNLCAKDDPVKDRRRLRPSPSLFEARQLFPKYGEEEDQQEPAHEVRVRNAEDEQDVPFAQTQFIISGEVAIGSIHRSIPMAISPPPWPVP